MANTKQVQTRSLELLRGPFCGALRAEREYGNENLARADPECDDDRRSSGGSEGGSQGGLSLIHI
eukprot:6467469-Alexandrium_andersonii.AAC.1